MDATHREIIMKNLDFLVQNTSDEAFEHLLEKFSSNHGLSPFMLQKIKTGTSLEKKKKFYEMVPKRGPEAFRKLSDCLYSAGLRNLAEKLRESRLFLDGGCLSKLNGSNKIENNNEEHYIIKSNPKGHVLIINIMNFAYHPNLIRNGSEKDVESLNKLWNNLGYSVEIHQDLEHDEFMKVIDDFINLTKTVMLDSVFVFIMTHGKRDDTNHREVKLQTSDSRLINSEWVLNRFTSVHCKHLADIPKVIFIQACRGEDVDFGVWVKDAAPSNIEYNENFDAVNRYSPRPRYSNLLIVFSTLPGYVSKRDPEKGAPFIQELCRVIKMKSKTSHLLDMINEVNRNLHEEVIKSWNLKGEQTFFQTVNYENWGFSHQLHL